MYINFVQFNDITSIQNDTFFESLSEFNPKELITSVLTETEQFLNYKMTLKMEEMPQKLIAEGTRMEYILISLLQKSV